jgi:effector-binding domain-containing protein
MAQEKESTMIVREPKIDERPEQPYLGLRGQTPHSEMPNFIPAGIDAVLAYLAEHGVAPAGAPFMRYHVINMQTELDLEIGVPVATTDAAAGTDRIRPGTLPAGRYASLVYRGVVNGLPANGALIKWVEEQGLKLDCWEVPAGDAFAGRYEVFLSGPDDNPDPGLWDTEVAMKLADKE